MEKNSRGKQLAKNTAILTVGKICTQCVSFFFITFVYSVVRSFRVWNRGHIFYLCGIYLTIV